jgi:hypothetical protein
MAPHRETTGKIAPFSLYRKDGRVVLPQWVRTRGQPALSALIRKFGDVFCDRITGLTGFACPRPHTEHGSAAGAVVGHEASAPGTTRV